MQNASVIIFASPRLERSRLFMAFVRLGRYVGNRDCEYHDRPRFDTSGLNRYRSTLDKVDKARA